MKIEERYRELLNLKRDINEKLVNLTFEKTKELVLWLKTNTMFQRLNKEDNQMNMLDCFCNLWIEEKKQLESIGIHEDIFYGIQSLEDVEEKYLTIKYCALRIENKVPMELCEQVVEELIVYHVSGIAMGKIFLLESSRRVENVVRLSQILKGKGETIRALYLLQYVDREYPHNKDILVELADCWLAGQQWKQAYDCLKQVEEEDKSVGELLQELEKVIGYGTVG